MISAEPSLSKAHQRLLLGPWLIVTGPLIRPTASLGENTVLQSSTTADVSPPADADAPAGSLVAADAVLARDFEQALVAHMAQTMAANRVIERDMMISWWRWRFARRANSRMSVTPGLSPTLPTPSPRPRHCGCRAASPSRRMEVRRGQSAVERPQLDIRDHSRRKKMDVDPPETAAIEMMRFGKHHGLIVRGYCHRGEPGHQCENRAPCM